LILEKEINSIYKNIHNYNEYNEYNEMTLSHSFPARHPQHPLETHQRWTRALTESGKFHWATRATIVQKMAERRRKRWAAAAVANKEHEATVAAEMVTVKPTLVRQNAVGREVREFKAGVTATEAIRNRTASKRKLLNYMAENGVYFYGQSWPGLSDGQYTRRNNIQQQVVPGSVLHMKTTNGKDYMRGVVGSSFRHISCSEFERNHRDYINAAWGSKWIPSGAPGGGRLLVCDVSWTKHTLTESMEFWLNKLTKNGGGCTAQQGTLIPLS